MSQGLLSDAPRVTKLLAEVVAPTTLATGLLFYFGWSHAYWFFDYFGVSSSLLGLSNADYFMRGLDGLFVPVTVLAVVGLVVLWSRTLLARASDRRWRLTWLPLALGVAGVLLGVNGLSRIFVVTPLNQALAVAPISLATGLLMITYAVDRGVGTRDRSSAARLAEYIAVFVLISLSLFWAANDYSAAVGRSRASQFVRELPTYPEAVVYSTANLNLAPSGVAEVRCSTADSAYRFRYSGLALMLQSGDYYVLLPKQWSPSDGVAMVLPRSDEVRLEFRRAVAADSLPATC